MEAMKLTEKQLAELYSEECLVDENDNVLFELVDGEAWEDGGKYSSTSAIFKDERTGKHYSFGITRSGSYFSHYEYEFDTDITEVELREVVIKKKKWVNV